MGSAQANKGLIASYTRWRSSSLGRTTDRLEWQLLFELAAPLAGQQLLDVGCGDGALAAEFARHSAIVTALDADPVMIAAARRRREITSVPMQLVEGQAENLPFGDGTFDRVVATTVLCFVRGAEHAFAEMARVLKPGGRLVIGELGRFSLWAARRRIRGWLGDPIWQAAAFRTVSELRDFAEAAGLEEVQIRGAVHYPPCAVAAKILAPVDSWIGRHTTFASAFLALSAKKPVAAAGS